MRLAWLCCTAILLLTIGSRPAASQIIVSAEDGKQLVGAATADTRTRDEVSVLSLAGNGLRVLGKVGVPTSMIGPPRSIVLTGDARFAIVSAAQQLDTAQPPGLAPGNSLSVIDLRRPARPRLVQTVAAGAGASGIAYHAGTGLVLVANAVADSVSSFRFAGGRLTPVDVIALDAGAKPVAVDILPDGRSAVVVVQNAGGLERIDIAAGKLARRGERIRIGAGAYSLAVTADGRFAFVTSLGGRTEPATPPPRGRRVGDIVAVDLQADTVIDVAVAGVTPEHVVLSSSGRWLAAVLINGSNADPAAANYRDSGELRVFAVDNGRLRAVASHATGRWCQGAEWTPDERRVLLQCASARQIEVYRFDGTALSVDPAQTVSLQSRPGAIAIQRR